MKKTMLMLVLASLSMAFVSAGCQSEAKVDDDGAKVEVKPTN
jgi:outer membrane murein-binding lipoprotein Lpp